MSMFRKQNNILVLINSLHEAKEKDLQRLIEENLKTVLDMHFLATEFKTANGRIDTLAIDSDGAPVIIEYKRKRNDNVINQSLSYLKWLTAQPPEFFEMLMQRNLPAEVLENIRLDWKHPRVVCIAESFSQYDIDTVEIVPLRIELFKYRRYEGDLLSLEAVAVKEAHLPVEADSSVIDAMKEQVNASHLIRTMFDELREKILAMDPYIIEKVGRRSVSYRLTKNFAEVLMRKGQLVISLRPIDYEDPKGMVERIAEDYTVTMNRRITLSAASELDYAMGIIEQSWKSVI